MITIINFSLPVHDDRPDIKLIVGDEYETIDVNVHLDQSRTTLLPAIDYIFAEAKYLAGSNIRNIDYVILPRQSIAAVLIVEMFRQSGFIPNILRMAPVKGKLLLRFVEVVRLRQPHVEEADEGSFGGIRSQ